MSVDPQVIIAKRVERYASLIRPTIRYFARSGKSLIWLSSPKCKNIFVSIGPKSPAYCQLSRALQEGRFAIVTDVGQGVRWTRGDRKTNDPDVDGEVVWS